MAKSIGAFYTRTRLKKCWRTLSSTALYMIFSETVTPLNPATGMNHQARGAQLVKKRKKKTRERYISRERGRFAGGVSK